MDDYSQQWVDLNGEGVNGVLSEQGGEWFYQRNLGRGRFAPTEVVASRPSTASLRDGGQQWMDLDGDGDLELVDLRGPAPGFYSRTAEARWTSFRTFNSLPVLDWDDQNVRFADVTGDGLADVLITEDEAISWHASLGKSGFAEGVRVQFSLGEDRGPRVVFDDGAEFLHLADMTGDGLSDLVRIRNGEVSYWPNLGYGRFGAKVTMERPPWFEDEALFDQRRMRLADTDGSGTTDIIYFGAPGVRIFLNELGNGWSTVRTVPSLGPITEGRSAGVLDLLGRGTACLVWSSGLPADQQRPLRYIDLMCGRKPHLLTKIVNNLGAETEIEYASSTEFYLADNAAQTPWITRLPFPVMVVKRVATLDRVSRNCFVRRYSYHHGHYDGIEREFRGFARIDQLDTEELGALGQAADVANEETYSNVPPVMTKTWFHTGAYHGRARISRHLEHEYYREGLRANGEANLPAESVEAMQLPDSVLPENLPEYEMAEACRALKGLTLREEVYALDGSERARRPYTISEHNYQVRMFQPRAGQRYSVFFTHPRESLIFHYERKLYDVAGERRADPQAAHEVTLAVDDFGNVLQSASIGYGRRFSELCERLTEADREKQRAQHITIRQNTYTNAVDLLDAYRAPSVAETRGYELLNCQPKSSLAYVTNLFRFDELTRVAAAAGDGAHDLPFETSDRSVAGEREPYRRLLDRSRTVYRAATLDRLLAPGALDALALAGELYRLTFTPGLLAQVYGDRIPDPNGVLGTEGGYLDLDGDGHWWAPSGLVFYSPTADDPPARELEYAANHFFLVHRYRDPFGADTIIQFDDYNLAPVATHDPVGNVLHYRNDYRVLEMQELVNANGARSAVAFDALGQVIATAEMGRAGYHEGDLLEGLDLDLDEAAIIAHLRDPFADPEAALGNATTRLIYDLNASLRSGAPAAAYTLARETHVADLRPGEKTKIQHSFSYSDGFGREIQKKTQAAPGPLTDGGQEVEHRWIGAGWTIFNNKGKLVRQYEPFFDDTQDFRFANKIGVSATLFYDPVDRVVATAHPNHSWEKSIFEPWGQEVWDVNDTALLDPAADPDVGDFFRRLPEADYLPTWYNAREFWRPWTAGAGCRMQDDGSCGNAEHRSCRLDGESVSDHRAQPAGLWERRSRGRSYRPVPTGAARARYPKQAARGGRCQRSDRDALQLRHAWQPDSSGQHGVRPSLDALRCGRQRSVRLGQPRSSLPHGLRYAAPADGDLSSGRRPTGSDDRPDRVWRGSSQRRGKQSSRQGCADLRSIRRSDQ